MGAVGAEVGLCYERRTEGEKLLTEEGLVLRLTGGGGGGERGFWE